MEKKKSGNSRVNKIRLFIAVNLNDKLKEQIGRIIYKLKNKDSAIKWVENSNLHITLKFLGEIPEEKIETIKNSLENLIAKYRKFSFKLSRLDVFPNVKSPRVIWLGISEGKDSLIEMNNRIEEEMEKVGFAREDKNFKGHITLGRVKKFKKIYNIEKLLEIETGDLEVQEVKHIELMKSTLHPSGPVYESLGNFFLNNAS
ncbi:MAG TPA: RNA 2',3'-cyclic phosphodiesterase [Candidatus Eremiobacteraeota bacterium]|nr:MAG: 2'-5'-RNA ligase [bacterium ADurb.Bin363]HPZ10553.1 RNA 2',3'-cyclic phosphodiesterase [Candidatus Eremiobacteraeota bacterium]